MAVSNLERILEGGGFSVTAELGPPMSGSAAEVEKKSALLRGFADAANVTDNPTAIVRMSSVAASAVALRTGLEPVMQMTCRDRNRIAIQSDLLGAYGLGIRNVLLLSGDHQTLGNHPGAKNVYDVDPVQAIAGVNAMMHEGVLMGGAKLKEPVEFFLGAVANPFADPAELQLMKLEKKIRAGARFIQTQAVYDIEAFSEWMERVRQRGLHEQAYFLAGVVVNRSARSMEATAKVPGMRVPDALIARMKAAENKEEEGERIALKLIGQIKAIEGISGAHIMAIGWESVVPNIVERAGLLPRPASQA